jgi:hypothetical protein
MRKCVSDSFCGGVSIQSGLGDLDEFRIWYEKGAEFSLRGDAGSEIGVVAPEQPTNRANDK